MKHLIFNSEKAVIDAENYAAKEEGLEKNGTKHVFFDPQKGAMKHLVEEKYAIRVANVLMNRSWYPEIESMSDEVIEELSDDWFE